LNHDAYEGDNPRQNAQGSSPERQTYPESKSSRRRLPLPRGATTGFVVERALPRSSLLRVRLRTGRTHQIRVHLEAIGHPVVGDAVYAGRSPGETYGLERQFLHAARLAFDHPVTGARVDVRSPLPEDLAAALAQAERRGGPSTATPRSG